MGKTSSMYCLNTYKLFFSEDVLHIYIIDKIYIYMIL